MRISQQPRSVKAPNRGYPSLLARAIRRRRRWTHPRVGRRARCAGPSWSSRRNSLRHPGTLAAPGPPSRPVPNTRGPRHASAPSGAGWRAAGREQRRPACGWRPSTLSHFRPASGRSNRTIRPYFPQETYTIGADVAPQQPAFSTAGFFWSYWQRGQPGLSRPKPPTLHPRSAVPPATV
jgi:hypothetical protein